MGGESSWKSGRDEHVFILVDEARSDAMPQAAVRAITGPLNWKA
jgi:hypothetical protein